MVNIPSDILAKPGYKSNLKYKSLIILFIFLVNRENQVLKKIKTNFSLTSGD
jgi:hypothetical protein